MVQCTESLVFKRSSVTLVMDHIMILCYRMRYFIMIVAPYNEILYNKVVCTVSQVFVAFWEQYV